MGLSNCSTTKILLLIGISFFHPGTTNALSCYQCNSYSQSNCTEHYAKECRFKHTNNTNDSNSPQNTTIEVCVKQTFLIKDEIINEVDGIKSGKSMTKPRNAYYCGRYPKAEANKCISYNSQEIRQKFCTCSTDLCNGSAGHEYYHNHTIYLLFLLPIYQLLSHF